MLFASFWVYVFAMIVCLVLGLPSFYIVVCSVDRYLCLVDMGSMSL